MLCLPSYLVCPSYLSSKKLQIPTRFIHETKDEENFARAIRLSLEQQTHDIAKFTIHNFQTLVTDIFSLPLSNKWMIWYSDSNLHIFMPKFQDYALTIVISLLIKENLGDIGFRDNS